MRGIRENPSIYGALLLADAYMLWWQLIRGCCTHAQGHGSSRSRGGSGDEQLVQRDRARSEPDDDREDGEADGDGHEGAGGRSSGGGRRADEGEDEQRCGDTKVLVVHWCSMCSVIFWWRLPI